MFYLKDFELLFVKNLQKYCHFIFANGWNNEDVEEITERVK